MATKKVASVKSAATKKSAKKGGKLIQDLQSRREGALSRGCGSQVGAMISGISTAPVRKDPQKPRKK